MSVSIRLGRDSLGNMTPETHALLTASDHPTACETPPGFNHEHEVLRVRALMPLLQHLAGVELQLDDQVQDASFFCDVARSFYPVILIRFSSFGQLVTITHSDELDPSVIGRLIAALRDAEFNYVPADELEDPYTGSNPKIGAQSWWIRFFDYL